MHIVKNLLGIVEQLVEMEMFMSVLGIYLSVEYFQITFCFFKKAF